MVSRLLLLTATDINRVQQNFKRHTKKFLYSLQEGTLPKQQLFDPIKETPMFKM